MSEPLTREECALIVESLLHTRNVFERYDYPAEELRRERLADVDRTIAKLRALRRSA